MSHIRLHVSIQLLNFFTQIVLASQIVPLRTARAPEPSFQLHCPRSFRKIHLKGVFRSTLKLTFMMIFFLCSDPMDIYFLHSIATDVSLTMVILIYLLFFSLLFIYSFSKPTVKSNRQIVADH